MNEISRKKIEEEKNFWEELEGGMNKLGRKKEDEKEKEFPTGYASFEKKQRDLEGQETEENEFLTRDENIYHKRSSSDIDSPVAKILNEEEKAKMTREELDQRTSARKKILSYQEFVKKWYAEHPDAKVGTTEVAKQIADDWKAYKKSIEKEGEGGKYIEQHPQPSAPPSMPRVPVMKQKAYPVRVHEERKRREEREKEREEPEESCIEKEKLGQGAGGGQQPFPPETRKTLTDVEPGKVTPKREIPEGEVHEHFKKVQPGKTHEEPFEGKSYLFKGGEYFKEIFQKEEAQQPIPPEVRERLTEVEPGKVPPRRVVPEGEAHEHFKEVQPGKTHEKPFEGESYLFKGGSFFRETLRKEAQEVGPGSVVIRRGMPGDEGTVVEARGDDLVVEWVRGGREKVKKDYVEPVTAAIKEGQVNEILPELPAKEISKEKIPPPLKPEIPERSVLLKVVKDLLADPEVAPSILEKLIDRLMAHPELLAKLESVLTVPDREITDKWAEKNASLVIKYFLGQLL